MGHMNVPWAVGGGALNSEGLARMLPYFMFGGMEGILNATDCQVRALNTPGDQIRVAPGGYTIKARGTGQLYESYMGKIETEDVIDISPTSGVSRSDLIIARVEDPNIPGEPWTDPVDVAVGPYVFTRVIENVSSTIRDVQQLGNNFSAITLARIDIPAFTSTITNAMIKDLRCLINPVTGGGSGPDVEEPEGEASPSVTDKFYTAVAQGSGSKSTSDKLPPTPVNVWKNWPLVANWVVPIPSWATSADIFFQISSAQYPENAHGEARININSDAVVTPAFQYDVNDETGPGDQRYPITVASTVSLGSSLRGKNIRFKAQARSLTDECTDVYFDRASSAYMLINFKQSPTSS